MIPSIEEFMKASCRWDGEHRGVRYEISWHGKIWCWYLLLPEEQFQPEDWSKLLLKQEDTEFAGSFWRHWDYDSFPDIDAHGGWTYGVVESYLSKDGKEFKRVKVGCDYNHSWDRDAGYPDTLASITRDVQSSIDQLLKLFPNVNERCSWSGRWAASSELYTSKNGARVLKGTKVDHPAWQPVESGDLQ